MPITLLDGILVGFTLVSAMLAMVRGLSREVLSVISWVLAAAAAFFFYKPVLPYVQPYIDNEKIAMGAAGVPEALTCRRPFQAPPRAKSRESPGSSGAASARARDFQAVAGERPSAASLPSGETW